MRLKLLTPAAMAALILLAAAPAPAFAYVGPGLGFGALGTALGVLGAILLGLVSILWYPCKRMVRRLRGQGARPKPRLRTADAAERPRP